MFIQESIYKSKINNHNIISYIYSYFYNSTSIYTYALYYDNTHFDAYKTFTLQFNQKHQKYDLINIFLINYLFFQFEVMSCFLILHFDYYSCYFIRSRNTGMFLLCHSGHLNHLNEQNTQKCIQIINNIISTKILILVNFISQINLTAYHQIPLKDVRYHQYAN